LGCAAGEGTAVGDGATAADGAALAAAEGLAPAVGLVVNCAYGVLAEMAAVGLGEDTGLGTSVDTPETLDSKSSGTAVGTGALDGCPPELSAQADK
ncbi:hypothetical protein J4475_03620, partial [Candidatus Woesearchaeota archaeon]|nr:hypothetical protein [Candidatus Woesearchaeota archaeon]